MGTWGTGIFDSDLALDVRAAFRDRVAAGATASAATRGLLAEWQGGFDDPEDGPVLWLALAEAQWDAGRLDPAVKRRALALLAAGADVTVWQGDAPARTRELDRLGRKLARKPPAAKRITSRRQRETELEVGDLFAYRLPDGREAALWVIKVDSDKGGPFVILELLDFSGKKLPSVAALRKLPARLTRLAYAPHGRRDVQFWVLDLARRVDPARRLRLLAQGFQPARPFAATTGPICYLNGREARPGTQLEALILREL